ncbi:MAG: metalloregulator ArsR/SmtB family transcription factor [Thermomicrobiales bacterium]
MQATFDVLVDPHRRQILSLLRDRPHAVGELVERTGLSQPGVSRHLRVLRETGFVSVVQKGQSRVYQLERMQFAELDRWLDDYRRLWSHAFDTLGKVLDTPQPITDEETDS